MKVTRRGLFAGAAAVGAAAQPSGKKSAEPPEPGRRFTGQALKEIAFPLGGIGTGTVSLGGRGDLRDWETFNRPNKGGVLPFTFAALRLAGGGLAKPVIRVLERQAFTPFTGGSGVPRETGLGLPRLRGATFTGAYPFATIRFQDTRFPVEVALEAFNPMIPLATDDSSLPLAALVYRFTSRAPSKLEAAAAFSIMNPVGYDGVAKLRGRNAPFFGRNVNEFKREGSFAGLLLSSGKYAPDSARRGSLAVATRDGDLSWRLAWEHGAWWDEFQKWWDEFLAQGRFPNNACPPSADGATEYATLASHFTLRPGETKQVVFVLAWHFPNTENYWTRDKEHHGKPVRNHYGTKWSSAWDPAAHLLANYDALRARSLAYRDALWNSTLPAAVLDAVSSQASIMRTNTVMVLEGKRTMAFEGCNDNTGCCPMNCTHVYNYEQAMAFLYPDLERSMRETDFLVNLNDEGAMGFRTAVPLRKGGTTRFPAADGQMGCVMKVYREWQLSGDDAWLRKLWPEVRRGLEYAWKKWDVDGDGVMEGEQHNTYDIEFYGPNTMMGTFYLGALLAATRMARRLGDNEAAARYEALFGQGARRLDTTLWNGEYYVQKVDATQEKAARYQYGEGCLSDQLLGQWFAEVVNLGKLLPHDRIRSALRAIFKYNFREEFHDFANAQRLYAMNDESGLLLCSWPRGRRPALPFVYSDEVWTGIEYQVAAHLVYEGMVKEGLAIVRAVRDRYDGVRRNPWNEVECGHHYARAMASWSLLTAFSGFAWSAPEKELRFRPRTGGAIFRALFSTGTAWGTYSQETAAGGLKAELRVHEGALELARLRLPFSAGRAKVSAPMRAGVEIADGEALVTFTTALRLGPGARATVVLTPVA